MIEVRMISFAGTVLIASVIGPALIVNAGSLTPPPGAIAPTMKDLNTVEPRTAINSTNTPGDTDSVFRIASGGSYYLLSNILGESGKHGIEIDTSDTVSIDLCGFTLLGVTGSMDGIHANGRVDFRNGSAERWDGNGFTIGRGTISGVNAQFNVGHGLRTNSTTLVSNSAFLLNGGHGLAVGDTSRVSHCVITNNDGWGIDLDGACTVEHCLFYSNELGGISGGLSIMRSCMFFSQGGPAIEDAGFSLIMDNLIQSAPEGIVLTGINSRVEGNNISVVLTGIEALSGGNFIARNTVRNSDMPYDIAVGNTVGEILDFSAGGTITASNPWANFEY